jgi:hypothetical protein
LTSLVAAGWRLPFERITDWLARYDALAVVLGYDQFDPAGRRRTISLAQYSRRYERVYIKRKGGGSDVKEYQINHPNSPT